MKDKKVLTIAAIAFAAVAIICWAMSPITELEELLIAGSVGFGMWACAFGFIAYKL